MPCTARAAICRTSAPSAAIADGRRVEGGPDPDVSGRGTRAGHSPAEAVRSRDFERLYDAHAGQLLAFLIFRTGDRALADDLLADTFERVLRDQAAL